ncbi:MAG: hypothetical protein AAGE01_17650 [Pseudomonadota bacterium]
MSQYVTFKLISMGVASGHAAEEVAVRLSKALKLPPEKAQALTRGNVTLKRGLTKANAEDYQRKLATLGLTTHVERVAPPRPSSGMALELEPLGDEPEPEPEPGPEPTEAPETPETPETPEEAATTITCPKCGHVQPKAEQCEACGVFFHKLAPNPPEAGRVTGGAGAEPIAGPPADDRGDDDDEDDDERAPTEQPLQPKALAGAAAVALLGALVWRFIATAFGLELGALAWAIGGAVGFTAASLGSEGRASGVACAILVLLSIVFGKYMTVDEVKDQVADLFMGIDQTELVALYDEEMADAEAFASVSDEASLRGFMVERDYTDRVDPATIPAADVAAFEAETRPRLLQLRFAQPSYEQWLQGLMGEFSDISSFEILQESFGLFDIIFLVLGMTTAFRLGSRES